MYNIRLDHPLALLTVCPPGCSLVEEMYTSSDVEEMLDGLKKVVRVGDHLIRRNVCPRMETAAQELMRPFKQESFRSELSKNLNMSVLILKQIFEEAEQQVKKGHKIAHRRP